MKTCSVKIRGCSGIELFYCRGEATAKRIRKAIKLYSAESRNFTGAYTLSRLVSLASDRKGISAREIVQEFVLGGTMETAECIEKESASEWQVN